MKSIFLSHEQLFEKPLPVFQRFGTLAPPTDLALLTCRDDGFLTETGTGINYYLAGDGCVDRFGRGNPCAVCAIRPAFQLMAGEEALLKPVPLQKDTVAAGPAGEARVVPVLFGTYPTAALDASLQDLAMKRFREGTLRETGQHITIRGEKYPLYRLGAKRILALSPEEGNANGYVQLSDGSVVSEGDLVFLECRPVRWLWDEKNALLVAGQALFGGCSREEAAAYLADSFRDELLSDEDERLPSAGESWHISSHTELSLIRAYVEANVPVFIHGLSGDGKSDRVREIDPQALDQQYAGDKRCGGQDGIEQITHHSPKTRDETIPTTLVQCPANSQHTHRAHRRTRDDAHNQSFDHKDHRIYRVQKHIRLQISRFFSTYDTFFGKK